MRRCVESGIAFDFSAAAEVFEHDKTSPDCTEHTTADGNTVWKGVDFRIRLTDGTWIWLEVKHWQRRPGNFKKRLEGRSLPDEILTKFLGTTAFLAWHERFAHGSVQYVALLEPPRQMDSALRATAIDRIRQDIKVPTVLPRRIRIQVFVVNIDGWNTRFPNLRAERV